MCDNWKKEYEVNFTREDFKKIILTLKLKFHCDYIRFHGQEATLYKDLNDLIEFSKKMKMRVALKTNGWLLTDKRLYRALDVWLDELYLSIDSGEAKLHDEIRWIPGSFEKNIDLVKKTKAYTPWVKVFFNSVVMSQSYKTLPKLLDICHKFGVDRQSFVFLNDKNRKDIGHVNLSKQQFISFFYEEIPTIYEKAISYNIPVDFSPFISQFVAEKPEIILQKIQNKDQYLNYQILNFYQGMYGKDFYDRYGCHGPIDHSSINYNGDMFWCCVVERARDNKVGNVISEELSGLWNDPRYRAYRKKSNFSCSYGHKCASNFYTRKQLFQEIYLNESLFDLSNPNNYYRYLKEIGNLSLEIFTPRQEMKLQKLLWDIGSSYSWYRDICRENSVDISLINQQSFQSLPVISKNQLSELYDFVDSDILHAGTTSSWHTSGSTGFRLDFIFPNDFKRHIRQIAMFSEVSNFTFHDGYYSVTPVNCNQGGVTKDTLPPYVKKQYITLPEFSFWKKDLEAVKKQFSEKDYSYLYGDSKYILYIILLYEKFQEKLPVIEHVFLSYSYTNRGLREFIGKTFDCEITEIYGCSEVWPIGYSQKSWEYTIFGDSLIVEEIDGDIVVTDLENPLFPFIRYKNGDSWKVENTTLIFEGKKWQSLWEYSLTQIDEYMYKEFPEIVYYQFIWDVFLYYSEATVDIWELQTYLKKKFGKIYSIEKRGQEMFFQVSTECGKYKTIQ